MEERNLLRIRIMMKDSLLIHKSAQQFNEMMNYAYKQGINVYIKEGGILTIYQKNYGMKIC